MEDLVEQVSADRPGSASVQRSAMLEVQFKYSGSKPKKKEMNRDFCLLGLINQNSAWLFHTMRINCISAADLLQWHQFWLVMRAELFHTVVSATFFRPEKVAPVWHPAVSLLSRNPSSFITMSCVSAGLLWARAVSLCAGNAGTSKVGVTTPSRSSAAGVCARQLSCVCVCLYLNGFVDVSLH